MADGMGHFAGVMRLEASFRPAPGHHRAALRPKESR